MSNHPTPERQALEAEADRLLGQFIRISMIAKKERIGFLEAGSVAIERGIVSEADWDLIRQMADSPSPAEMAAASRMQKP